MPVTAPDRRSRPAPSRRSAAGIRSGSRSCSASRRWWCSRSSGMLVRRLGLPDWVLSAPAGLLADRSARSCSLTGLHERQRAVARTTGLRARLSRPGRPRWLTWRKALLGGGLAFGALALVAGGLHGHASARHRSRRHAGRVRRAQGPGAAGAGRFREPHRRLDARPVAHRGVPGRPEPVAHRPAAGCIGSIADALQRMERTESGSLPAPLARELAEREGIKGVVTGQIDPVGKGYVLSASLLGAADGHVLTAVRETRRERRPAARCDRPAVQEAPRAGRRVAGLDPREPRRCEQVTTGSLPALATVLRGAPPRGGRQAGGGDRGCCARRWRSIPGSRWRTGSWRSSSATPAATTRPRSRRRHAPSPTATDCRSSRATSPPATTTSGSTTTPPPRRRAYRAALNLDPDNLSALNNLAVRAGQRRQLRRGGEPGGPGTRIGRGRVVLPERRACTRWPRATSRRRDSTLARYAAKSPSSPILLALRARLSAARQDYAAATRLHAAAARGAGVEPALAGGHEPRAGPAEPADREARRRGAIPPRQHASARIETRQTG